MNMLVAGGESARTLAQISSLYNRLSDADFAALVTMSDRRSRFFSVSVSIAMEERTKFRFSLVRSLRWMTILADRACPARQTVLYRAQKRAIQGLTKRRICLTIRALWRYGNPWWPTQNLRQFNGND